MKRKIYAGIVLALALTSCSDVPAPYNLLKGISGGGKTMPYKNASLNNGWTAYALTPHNPWSQGSSYTQATGYQDWEGTGSKSNVETEGYLISPAINTQCASGHVKISFDQTIRYTNQVSGWAENEKIFVSNNYSGRTDDFNAAHWVQLPYTPTASPYSDWTTYTSGDIQLPDTLVGTDSVYVAFYFKSPATASTTWELMNFTIEEGLAGTGAGDQPVVTPSEPKGEGTQASPYNVAKTIAVCSALAAGETTTSDVYVEGIISQIKAIDITQYGNAQYYISDDGTTANQFYIYRGFGLGGAKFTSESDIKVGDKVVVKGKLTNYNGTLEMTNGNSIVSLNSTTSGGDKPQTGGAEGNGTEQSPYNVAGILAYTSALAADVQSADKLYFQGTVCATKDISPTYGNASFYISDDGTDAGDKFYVFRALGLDGKAITSADEVQVGDKVVICGKVVNYYGNTPETVQKEAYIVRLERNGSTQGGGDKPTTPTTADGVAISGTTVTLTNASVTAGTETETIDLGAYCQQAGMENAAEVSDVKGTQCTLLFSCGENTKYPPKYYTATKGVRCYANNTITFTGLTRAIARVVMTCDSYNGQDYVGQTTATLTANGRTLVYTNAGTGTTQLRVKSVTITYEK